MFCRSCSIRVRLAWKVKSFRNVIFLILCLHLSLEGIIQFSEHLTTCVHHQSLRQPSLPLTFSPRTPIPFVSVLIWDSSWQISASFAVNLSPYWIAVDSVVRWLEGTTKLGLFSCSLPFFQSLSPLTLEVSSFTWYFTLSRLLCFLWHSQVLTGDCLAQLYPSCLCV